MSIIAEDLVLKPLRRFRCEKTSETTITQLIVSKRTLKNHVKYFDKKHLNGFSVHHRARSALLRDVFFFCLEPCDMNKEDILRV